MNTYILPCMSSGCNRLGRSKCFVYIIVWKSNCRQRVYIDAEHPKRYTVQYSLPRLPKQGLDALRHFFSDSPVWRNATNERHLYKIQKTKRRDCGPSLAAAGRHKGIQRTSSLQRLQSGLLGNIRLNAAAAQVTQGLWAQHFRFPQSQKQFSLTFTTEGLSTAL